MGDYAERLWLKMPPDTREVEALVARGRRELENELKGTANDLKEVADRIEKRMGGLVDERVCAARVGKLEAELESGMAGMAGAINRLADEIKQSRQDTDSIVAGKVAVAIQRAEEGLKEKLRSQINDVTSSMRVPPERKKPPTKEAQPLLARMGENAKYIMALFILVSALASTCIGGAYYITGVVNSVKQSMAQQQAIQQQMMAKQANLTRELSREVSAAPVTYMDLDAGVPEPKSRRRPPRGKK